MSSNRSELTSCFYQRMEWTLQDRTLGNLVLVGVIVADIITKSQMFIERLSTCSSKPPNMHDRCNRNTGTLNRAMRNSETANRKKSFGNTERLLSRYMGKTVESDDEKRLTLVILDALGGRRRLGSARWGKVRGRRRTGLPESMRVQEKCGYDGT